jgi:phosphoribosylformylglycinamidine synthase
VFGQLGDASPDCEDPTALKRAVQCVQSLLPLKTIAAGHDRSDGGLLVAVLEMAFAGNCGVSLTFPPSSSSSSLLQSLSETAVQEVELAAVHELFSEELGLVLEVLPEHAAAVTQCFLSAGLPCEVIGHTTADKQVRVTYHGKEVLRGSVAQLRDEWEATSFALELRQTEKSCVQQVMDSLTN